PRAAAAARGPPAPREPHHRGSASRRLRARTCFRPASHVRRVYHFPRPCGTARRCAMHPASFPLSGGRMQFFIDSADVAEIKKALALGMCDGVTTNPSLVAKTGRSFEDVLREIVGLVPGPISAEVTATD